MDVPFQPENEPLPLIVLHDDGTSTATLGNLQVPLENLAARPSQSNRRNFHGIVAIDGNYVHTLFDHIQAEVYLVDTATNVEALRILFETVLGARDSAQIFSRLLF